MAKSSAGRAHDRGEIAALFAGAGLNGPLLSAEAVARLDGARGAYLLALRLPANTALVFRGNRLALPPGWYFYAGSAHGPGGIRARLARHFRRDKKAHWHIDRLTPLADRLFALAVPGGRECALVLRMAATGAVTFPLDGFGSSDCRRCRAHLMQLEPAATGFR